MASPASGRWRWGRTSGFRWACARLLEFLGAHDVPLQLAMPLYRRYGDQALEAVRANPYLLVDGELGVAFATADSLALDLGMEGTTPSALRRGSCSS